MVVANPALARRKLFIRIGRRNQKPGSGSSSETLMKRTTNIRWPDLGQILNPIRIAVVGGVATRHYMPERFTKDIDVAIDARDSAAATTSLAKAGYKRKGALELIAGSTWVAPTGEEIDVIEISAPWIDEALSAAQTNRDGQGLNILPLPFLALMKFQAGRSQDLADISRMLGQAPESTLQQVRAVFKRYLPDDLVDLESMIELGQLEYRSSRSS